MTATATAPTLRRFVGPGSTETAIFALSIVVGPVMSRALGDSDRGSFAAVVVPVQLLTWLALLGVPYGASMLVREVDRRRLVDSAWRIALMIGVPIAVIGWLVAPALLRNQPPEATTWFRIGMICVVIGLPATTAVHLRMIVTGGTWRTSLALNVHLVGYSVIVVGLALADRLDLWSGLLAWIGSLLLSFTAVTVIYRGLPSGLGDAEVSRRQLRTGRPQAFVALANVMLGRLDQIFLAVMSSAATLGHYAIAVTAAQLSLPLANGIASVVLPQAFADDQADGTRTGTRTGTREGSREGTDAPSDGAVERHAARFVFRVSLGIAIVTAVTAPVLLPWVFGSDFQESVTLLWLLLPGQVLFNTGWVAFAGQMGRRKGASSVRSLSVAAVASAVLLAPAIHFFGAAGAAVLTSLCQGLFLLGVRRGPSYRLAGRETRSLPA